VQAREQWSAITSVIVSIEEEARHLCVSVTDLVDLIKTMLGEPVCPSMDLSWFREQLDVSRTHPLRQSCD
jgi:hypothetical protein